MARVYYTITRIAIVCNTLSASCQGRPVKGAAGARYGSFARNASIARSAAFMPFSLSLTSYRLCGRHAPNYRHLQRFWAAMLRRVRHTRRARVCNRGDGLERGAFPQLATPCPAAFCRLRRAAAARRSCAQMRPPTQRRGAGSGHDPTLSRRCNQTGQGGGTLAPHTPRGTRLAPRAPPATGIKRTRPHHRRAKGEGGECPPHTVHTIGGSGAFYSITPSANAPIRPALERRGDVRKCHPSRARMSPLRLPFGRRAARVRFSGEPSPAACRGTDPKRAAAMLAGWRSSGGQPASFYLVFP